MLSVGCAAKLDANDDTQRIEALVRTLPDYAIDRRLLETRFANSAAAPEVGQLTGLTFHATRSPKVNGERAVGEVEIRSLAGESVQRGVRLQWTFRKLHGEWKIEQLELPATKDG